MTASDFDLDRVLTAWLAKGDETAPEDDVAAALRQVAVTSQRRPLLRRLPPIGGSLERSRWVVVLALLLVTLGVVAAAFGAGVIRLDRDRVQPPPVAPSTLRNANTSAT